MIWLTTALVAAVGASTAVTLWRGHHQTLRDARAALDSMARSAALGTSRSLFEIDAMLAGVQQLLDQVLTTAPLDDPAITVVLRQLDRQSLAVSDIVILDTAGREANRATPEAGSRQSYAGAAFFTVPRDETTPRLYIGGPQRARDGGWSIMVSRPLVRHGAIAGVVAAEVSVAALSDLLATIATTGETRIALARDDGVAIAPPQGGGVAIGGAVGRPLPLRNDLPMQVSRAVPGLPLSVTAARSRAEILRRWEKERTASGIGFALFTSTAAALAWLAARALRRGQFAEAGLRRSEGRLTRQTALLQSTLENIGEGLSVFDRGGRLIAGNRRFCELLDLPADLALGTSLKDILTRQAAGGDFGDVEPGAEVAQRLDEFYRLVPAVKERATPDGRTLQIRRRSMPDGAVVTIYSDITEIREGERKIIRARSEAELANRSKSEFLANMSHELRTPLNAIIGFSEIICSELFGPVNNNKYLEYMNDIHASSLHLLSIINDVLDMSKIEAGKLELCSEMVEIGSVVADVVRMMAERAQSRDIKIVSHLTTDGAVIFADPRALRQIFLNLLSNAVKFSRKGGAVTIRVARDRPGFVVFEIEDHGIGMTADEEQRALQPFGQAKPATTRDYGGTGLGLPITKGLVEAHGGSLAIDSRAGLGTTVRIMLPTHAELAAAEKPAIASAGAIEAR
ncbi:MAG: PAS-domain containing protein [Stellaceae bacterium]